MKSSLTESNEMPGDLGPELLEKFLFDAVWAVDDECLHPAEQLVGVQLLRPSSTRLLLLSVSSIIIVVIFVNPIRQSSEIIST